MAKADIPHTGVIVTRAEARALGLKHYYTGKPCVRGHLVSRLVSKGVCCECANIHSAAWRHRNPDKRRESWRSWTDRNREQSYAASALWREQNPEKARSYSRNWFARRKAADGKHTGSEIAELLKRQRRKCPSCQKSIAKAFEVDHIHPLSRGGANDISNPQLLCRHCNRTKSAKDPIAWAQENGRLL